MIDQHLPILEMVPFLHGESFLGGGKIHHPVRVFSDGTPLKVLGFTFVSFFLLGTRLFEEFNFTLLTLVDSLMNWVGVSNIFSFSPRTLGKMFFF